MGLSRESSVVAVGLITVGVDTLIFIQSRRNLWLGTDQIRQMSVKLKCMNIP